MAAYNDDTSSTYCVDYQKKCCSAHNWGNHKCFNHGMVSSLGEITIFYCFNCLAVKVVQENTYYDQQKKEYHKVVKETIVEPD
jgi:hypothetical protein